MFASTTMLFLNAYNSYCKSMKPNDRDRCVFLWFRDFYNSLRCCCSRIEKLFCSIFSKLLHFQTLCAERKNVLLTLGLLLIAFFFHFGVMMVIPLILLAEVGLYVRHKPIFYLVFGISFFLFRNRLDYWFPFFL